MKTLRGRFILSHILPIVLVVPLVGLITMYLLETQVLLTTVSSNLEQQATAIATAVTGNPDVLSDPQVAQQFLARIALQADHSLVLYDSAGNVITSSGAPSSDSAAADVADEALALAQSGQPKVSVTYGLLRQTAEVLVPVTGVDQKLIGMIALTHTLEGVANQIARLRWWMVGILLAELILGGLAGAVLALRLAAPIDHAARAVVDVSHGVRIDPIAPQGPQEIRALTDSVNELAERLRVLEDARRRSLANIVHELGRPLGAMRSAVHVLRGAAGDDPALREELLSGVEAQIERLEPLLNDLAQLHGQVSGEVRLAREATLVQEWLPPVLLPWRAAAIEKGLDWRAAIPSTLPEVSIDPTRMAQAVGNLLSNAIKYTPEPGQISVEAGASDLEWWISVADSGPGIAAEEQRQIFQPFYRSVRERRFPQGLGLGLTIAQQNVEAHGGRLLLDAGQTEGSRFVITLPLG
ncbi:MAG: HAMP domain-containing sensor histidine kinase [Caldilineales bacterium]